MTEVSDRPDVQNVSKNQQKKLLRKQRWEETKHERRKAERDKIKQKRKAAAEARAKMTEEELAQLAPRRNPPKLMSESDNKFRIVIDMDFEQYMTDDEIGKAVQQLGRIYSLNRRSDRPCQLFVSSMKGKIMEKCAQTNTGYRSWDINLSDSNYQSLFCSDGSCNASPDDLKRQFVYLSGDADCSLPDVKDMLADESKIYVIGGLVDHNRHKGLCYKLATDSGIKCAKLPINDYILLNQRHVLSTVAVFEILTHVLGSKKSWVEALSLAIPKRKIAAVKDSDTGKLASDTVDEPDTIKES